MATSNFHQIAEFMGRFDRILECGRRLLQSKKELNGKTVRKKRITAA